MSPIGKDSLEFRQPTQTSLKVDISPGTAEDSSWDDRTSKQSASGFMSL